MLAAVVAALADSRPAAAGWSVQAARAGDPSLVLLGPPDRGAEALVRIAHTPASRAGLGQAAAALDALAGLQPLTSSGTVLRLPTVLARSDGPDSWLVETALPGVPGTSALGDPTARRAVLRGAAVAARTIAEAASESIVVGPAEIDRWVTARVRAVRPLVPPAGTVAQPGGDALDALDALAAELSAALSGRALRIGWIHGDLWPANVLVEPGSWHVTGLVDWDSGQPGEPILQDLLHLALTTRRRVERRDLGALVAEQLRGTPWADEDRVALGLPDPGGDPIEPDPFGGLDPVTALWLYWLRAVESNLLRHPDLGSDRRWVRSNVLQVLACR